MLCLDQELAKQYITIAQYFVKADNAQHVQTLTRKASPTA
jgi:hypothetical protein